MRSIKKYMLIFLCSLFLLLITIYWFVTTNTTLPYFWIQSPDGSEAIQVSIFDADDGNHYVFLPSYAEMKDVTISLPTKETITLGEVELVNGMDCSRFALETAYELKGHDHAPITLWFYQSRNVATMFIDTASESMKQIHKNKDHKESASISFITADGASIIHDDSCYLKGRGNSTWQLDKRPYSLTVSPDTDLLGFGAATNWILLANAEDETNLRNKIVFDLAEKTGSEWVPQSAYVDVYLNGNYNGLYLLTERIEIHDERLDLNVDDGDFLCKIEYEGRQGILEEPFVTPFGRTVEITSPQPITSSQKTRIESLVAQMERSLLSNGDLSLSADLDLDSWVRRYLIDEIFDNVDSDAASSYFYYSDGTFYAGPVWDYDLAMGTVSSDPPSGQLAADRFNSAGRPKAPYYDLLYDNGSFYERMVEIYRTEYLPALEGMLTGEIEALATQIADATAMNSIRWSGLFSVISNWNHSVGQTPEDLIHYLDARVSFLSSMWLSDVEYRSLEFSFPERGFYWKTYVVDGEPLGPDLVALDGCEWLCADTGEIIDLSRPIESDMRLIGRSVDPAEKTHTLGAFISTKTTGELITMISILALLLVATMLLIWNKCPRRKIGD